MSIRIVVILAALLAGSAQAAWLQDPAPAFELPDLSGQARSLETEKGKVVFVHFWASWCTSCKEEFPKLNGLAAAYDAKSLAVLAVTVDKSASNTEKFLAKHVAAPLSLTVLRDPSGKTAREYRNRAIPITYVVDKKGVIRFAHMGFQEGDEARWRAEIDELLKEK